MSLPSRGVRVVARSLRRPLQNRPARRFASHEPGHGHGHAAGESAWHADAGVKQGGEGWGATFYLSLASIPLFYLVYTTATPDNFIQRMVDDYQSSQRLTAEKNVIRTKAVEQAVADSTFFANQATNTSGPDWRYPEQLNQGSPLNIVAGQGYADMSELVKYHAEEKRQRDAERTRASEDK